MAGVLKSCSPDNPTSCTHGEEDGLSRAIIFQTVFLGTLRICKGKGDEACMFWVPCPISTRVCLVLLHLRVWGKILFEKGRLVFNTDMHVNVHSSGIYKLRWLQWVKG